MATITFDTPAPRQVWVQAGPSTGPTADALKPNAAVVEVSLAGKKPTDNVYIWDHSTGNLAVTSVDALRKALNLVVGAKEFKDVAEVEVRLEHMGQPVSAAEVTVDDGKRPQTQLLDPTTKGELTFFDLKPGSLKVTAKYKTKAGAPGSVTQLVDAPLGHGDPSATAVVSISDDVATVTPAPAGATAPPAGTVAPSNAGSPGAGVPDTATTTGTAAGASGGKGTSNSGNPAGSAFGYLLGVGVVAALVYGLWRYARQNPDLVQSKLHQLGVDVPKPGDDPRQFDPAAPPAPRKPDPPQKIMLGADAAPDLLAPAAPSNFGTPIVATLTGEPQLLSETGDAMPLPAGETVVGRDLGLGLSLVGETTVSRRHAQLVRNGNEVTVTDLGSTNGTYVNGAALSGPQTLRPGDTVQFGAVRFRFQG
jgi:hypothetical protein